MSALGQKQTFAEQNGMSALPQKRTCAVQLGMSALCHKRTLHRTVTRVTATRREENQIRI